MDIISRTLIAVNKTAQKVDIEKDYARADKYDQLSREIMNKSANILGDAWQGAKDWGGQMANNLGQAASGALGYLGGNVEAGKYAVLEQALNMFSQDPLIGQEVQQLMQGIQQAQQTSGQVAGQAAQEAGQGMQAAGQQVADTTMQGTQAVGQAAQQVGQADDASISHFSRKKVGQSAVQLAQQVSNIAGMGYRATLVAAGLPNEIINAGTQAISNYLANHPEVMKKVQYIATGQGNAAGTQ